MKNGQLVRTDEQKMGLSEIQWREVKSKLKQLGAENLA
jgi:hypothetical protein